MNTIVFGRDKGGRGQKFTTCSEGISVKEFDFRTDYKFIPTVNTCFDSDNKFAVCILHLDLLLRNFSLITAKGVPVVTGDRDETLIVTYSPKYKAHQRKIRARQRYLPSK